jgi:NADH-quinone oxidoreductase subunit E
MPFSLDPDQLAQVDQILSRYPNKQAACIPVLHLCQGNNGGWISEDVIKYVASLLELTTAHVGGVVTFYSLFNSRPVGKHQVWVCHTLSCALRGADALLHHCEKRLGIGVGGTTADGRITLHTAECLASCGTAPAVQVDEEYHENLDVAALDRILDRLQQS